MRAEGESGGEREGENPTLAPTRIPSSVLARRWFSLPLPPSPPLPLVLAFTVLLFGARLGHRELFSSHEARAAQNAQRMLDTGEWGLPVLFDGQTDLQKPPGYYWLVAVVGWLNGGIVDEWVARLPAALAGLLTVTAVFVFLRREGRPAAAIVAALSLATAVHFTAIARTARIDVPLTLAVSAALFAVYGGKRYALAGVAAGCAVLLKGPVGLALILSTATAWLLLERKPTDSYPWAFQGRAFRGWAFAALTTIAVALPWFVWANHATGGEFFRVFFWHHTIARFTGSSPTLASHPWWYYAPRFAADFLPWTPAFALLVGWAVRSGRWRTDPLLRFGLVWFGVMFVVLSTAKFKRADYLLPAFPGAAIALGCAAEAWLSSRTNPRTIRIARASFVAALVAVTAGWAVMTYHVEPLEQQPHEKRAFADVIRSHALPPNQVLLFRAESHLLAFHLGRPLHTLVEWGELNELLAQPGPHFVVMPPEYLIESGDVLPHHPLEVVARLDEYTPAKPPRPLVFVRRVTAAGPP